MAKRKIIRINEKKCNGCGLCIPDCPEGALKVIDGKARLISDLFCDGLGACIGSCPRGAISIEEREAEPYDERRVIANMAKQGRNTIDEHLRHLKEHGEQKYLAQAVTYLKEKKILFSLESTKPAAHFHGCPGSMVMDMRKAPKAAKPRAVRLSSELRQWPVQMDLLPPDAPYFQGADILLAADCVPFACADFHSRLLAGKALAIGCPKLGDSESYKEKLSEIIRSSNPKSITVAIMEVPCCYGLYAAAEQALAETGKKIPLTKRVISISGDIGSLQRQGSG